MSLFLKYYYLYYYIFILSIVVLIFIVKWTQIKICILISICYKTISRHPLYWPHQFGYRVWWASTPGFSSNCCQLQISLGGTQSCMSMGNFYTELSSFSLLGLSLLAAGVRVRRVNRVCMCVCNLKVMESCPGCSSPWPVVGRDWLRCPLPLLDQMNNW